MRNDIFPTREAISAGQLAQLRNLLTLTAINRFYAAKFKARGVKFEIASLDDLKRLPFTTKTELAQDQEASPPFGTNLTFPTEQYVRFHQTSGTSGRPLRWLDTKESWDWMVERWLDIFTAAGVTRSDRILFAFSFGPFIGFWLAFEAGARLGALCLPAGGLTSHARLRMMLEAEVTVLCCTPTYAIRLVEVALEEKLDLSRAAVRRIIVAGEPGGSIPATRSRLEEFWPRARVFDHHGMTETGPVTFECPLRPGFLHVMECGFIPEIIDPKSGTAVEPGEPGELVLTNLGRFGSPLIRYRTGDVVKAAQPLRQAGAGPAEAPCPCGRHDLLLDGGILGRADDMVIVRGVNIYPTALENVLRESGQIAEFQVKVNRSGPLTELAVRIEPAASCRDVASLVANARKNLQNAFALRIPVEAVEPGTLPRFEMKAKRWVVV